MIPYHPCRARLDINPHTTTAEAISRPLLTINIAGQSRGDYSPFLLIINYKFINNQWDRAWNSSTTKETKYGIK